MKRVVFYEKADDELLRFAVIAAKYQGQWVLCRHKARSTWEFPGGHRETGETIEAAAVRESTRKRERRNTGWLLSAYIP